MMRGNSMDNRIDEVKALVKSFSGLNLDGTMEAQFADTMRRWLERYDGNIVTLLNVLKSGTDNLSVFISEITINESFFLRNKEHFGAALKHIRKVLDAKGEVNILSVGCSNGCEPYSMAMVAENHYPGILKKIKIHGLDISHKVIEQAREGVYHRWYLRHTDFELRNKFFTQKNNLFYIDENIKSAVKFHVKNLFDFSHREKFDIIFCRNFLIYFGDDIKSVLKTLKSFTESNGKIIFGNSDGLMIPTKIFDKSGYLYSFKKSQNSHQSEEVNKPDPAHRMEISGLNDIRVRIDYDIADKSKRPAKDESEYFKKGVKYIQTGQYAEGIKEFEVIIKNINPNNKRAKVFMAFCFYKIGENSKYQDIMNDLLTEEGLFYEAFMLNGIVLYESGQYEKSIKNFRKAIFVTPDSETAWFYMGKLYENFERNAEALKAYENALKFIKPMPEDSFYPLAPEITSVVLRNYINDRISILRR